MVAVLPELHSQTDYGSTIGKGKLLLLLAAIGGQISQ
jgi:hypothetical protein